MSWYDPAYPGSIAEFGPWDVGYYPDEYGQIPEHGYDHEGYGHLSEHGNRPSRSSSRRSRDVYDPIGFGIGQWDDDAYEGVSFRGHLDRRYPYEDAPPPADYVDRRYRSLAPALSPQGEFPSGPSGVDYASRAREAQDMERDRRSMGDGMMYGLPPARRGERNSRRPPVPAWGSRRMWELAQASYLDNDYYGDNVPW